MLDEIGGNIIEETRKQTRDTKVTVTLNVCTLSVWVYQQNFLQKHLANNNKIALDSNKSHIMNMVFLLLLILIGLFDIVVAATTITSGYYVLNIFSESTCSIAASQQTYLLNVCYASSTSGQYNIGVLQTDSTGTTFSSFTVTSSSSSASCTSLVTSGTKAPSSSYVGESCAYLSSGFYYSSTWSAYPSIVPTTTTSNYAFPNGYIIKEYDDDACSTTLPRTTAFFISTSTCVPYRSSLNSVITLYYVIASCSSSALTLGYL